MQIPRKLEDALDVGANCFESLRYPDLVPDAFFFLSDLPQALIEVIISLKPEWTAELAFRVPKPKAESTATGAIFRAPEGRRGWRQLWSKLSRGRS